MKTKKTAEILTGIDYLFSKINWKNSALDAKAIQIMNSLKTDIENLNRDCTNCYYFNRLGTACESCNAMNGVYNNWTENKV